MSQQQLATFISAAAIQQLHHLLCVTGDRANVTANLYVVPSSANVSTSNQALYVGFLQSGDTYQMYAAAEKLLLGPGDSIQVSRYSQYSYSAITSYTTI
jgi:protein involved in polysaccharide export with SLBB domain